MSISAREPQRSNARQQQQQTQKGQAPGYRSSAQMSLREAMGLSPDDPRTVADVIQARKKADREALTRQFMSPQNLQQEPQTVQQQQEGATSTDGNSNKASLPQNLVDGFKGSTGHDLSNVDVHYNSPEPENMGALAYAQGNDIYLSPSQEQHLPHEAAHIVQQREGRVKPTGEINGQPLNDEPSLESEADAMGAQALQMKTSNAATPNGNDESEVVSQRIVQRVPSASVYVDAKKLYDAMDGLGTDEDAIFEVLKHKTVAHLKQVRTAYRLYSSNHLEIDLKSELNATLYKQAMMYLLPAVPIYDRLQTHMSFWGDNEAAMVEIIKTADQASLTEARAEPRLKPFLQAQLNNRELFEVEKILWPNELYYHVVELIKNSAGTFDDDEEAIFMAVLELSEADRKRIWDYNKFSFYYLSGYEVDESEIEPDTEYGRMRRVLLGTRADALKAGMEEATDGAGTFDDLVAKLAEETGKANQQEQMIREMLRKGELPNGDPLSDEFRVELRAELEKLGNISGNLLNSDASTYDNTESSFLGMLEGDVSTGELQNFSQQMGLSDFMRAKQMIITAPGFFDDDERAIKTAFEGLSPELRQQLWSDWQVQFILIRYLNEDEIAEIVPYREGDTYATTLEKLEECDGFWNDDEAGIMTILLKMNEADRKRLDLERPPKFIGVYEDLNTEEKAAADEILRTGKLETMKALRIGGEGAGTEEQFINDTFERMNAEERLQMRIGYALSRGFEIPASIVSPIDQVGALFKFNEIIAYLEGELGTDDMEVAIDKMVGSPTLKEYQTDGGSSLIMFILNQRVVDKGAYQNGSFGDWFVGLYSESGGVADEAQMSSQSYYLRAMEDQEVSDEELAVMGFLSSEFAERYQEHVEASDIVADIASTVAAIVVAIVLIAATGGTDAPAVIPALASYLGISNTAATAIVVGIGSGATKMLSKEAIGQEHNDMSEDGFKDFAVGSVDGAMMVLTAGVGKALQQSFASLVGLEGSALTAELSVGALRAADIGIKQLGGRAISSGIRHAFEGILSSVAGELVLTAMDEETWRKGIWDTIVSFGSALLRGIVIGGTTGFVMGGAMETFASIRGTVKARNLFMRMEATGFGAERLDALNLEQITLVAKIDEAIDAADWQKVNLMLSRLERGMDEFEFERLRNGLTAGNSSKLESVKATLGNTLEIHRISNLRRINPVAREYELGYDFDRNIYVDVEAEAAFELEVDWGFFKRIGHNEIPGKKGDWVGLSGNGLGKTFDEFGGSIPDNPRAVAEITRKAKSKMKFFGSIDDHFIKSDYVILNLTNLKKHDIALYLETMKYIKENYGFSKMIDITK